MKKKKALSILLVVSLVASMTACAAKDSTEKEAVSTASEIEENDEASLLLEVMEQVVPSHSSSAGKDETVYVLMDANGENGNVIVSEQLKNKYGDEKLTDTTELTDIVNVNGYGNYTENADGTITWDTYGSDLYYRGTTDKELPVKVSISYELDGESVSADELAGKSGHVKIRLDYENNTKETVEVDGEDYEVSIPFAFVSGMILPNDNFNNVEVTNGRVVSEGSNQVVIGIAYPGLRESLDWDSIVARAEDDEAREKLEDINFSEYVEIEADVTDFTLGMTMSLAGCNLFNRVDVADSLDLSELQDKIDELADGSSQIVDGVKELKDGTTELYDGTKELKDGTKELRDGADDLKDGTGELRDGAVELKNGTGELYDGTVTLKNGTNDLYNGTGTLYSGIVDYTNGANSVYDGAKKLADGASSAKDGAAKLKAGFQDNDIVGNAKKLATGAGALNNGVNELVSSLSGLMTMLPTLKKDADDLTTIGGTLKGCIGTTTDFSTALSAQGISESRANELFTKYNVINPAEQQSVITVSDCSSFLTSYSQCVAGLSQAGYYDTSSSRNLIKLLNLNPQIRTVAVEYKMTEYASEGEEDEAVEIKKDDEPEEAKESELEDSETGEGEEENKNTEDNPDIEGNEPVEGSSEDENEMEQPPEPGEGQYETDEDMNNENGTDALTEDDEQAEDGTNAPEKTAAKTKKLNNTSTPIVLYNANNAVPDQIKTAIKGAIDSKAACSFVAGACLYAGGTLNAMYTQLAPLTQKASSLAELQSGAKQLSDGMAALSAGLSAISDGVSALDSGLGTLSNGASELSSGAGTLVSNNGKLIQGASDLRDGAGKLNDGAYDLLSGAGKLNDGAFDLLDGVIQLDDGASDLKDGVVKLDDGAADLNDGALRLDDGVKELLDGVLEFDEEGIQKITELVGDDTMDLLNRFKAIRQAGEDYTTFTGALALDDEDYTNTVKFIYKTGAVSAE